MGQSIPDKFAIQWLVGREHVSATDADIRDLIESRLPADVVGTDTAEQMVTYALVCHHENQDLYIKVMGGMI